MLNLKNYNQAPYKCNISLVSTSTLFQVLLTEFIGIADVESERLEFSPKRVLKMSVLIYVTKNQLIW